MLDFIDQILSTGQVVGQIFPPRVNRLRLIQQCEHGPDSRYSHSGSLVTCHHERATRHNCPRRQKIGPFPRSRRRQ